MKTAYETLLSIMNKDCESVFKDSNGDGYVDLSLYTFETAMKEYAKQVATQALKDASETATLRYIKPYNGNVEVDKESITNVEIKLP